MVLHDRILDPFWTTQGQQKTRLESVARGVLVRPIKDATILLFADEAPVEYDSQFIRLVYRKIHLSSMPAIRKSVDVSDARLERNLRYEHVKLNFKGQLRNRIR